MDQQVKDLQSQLATSKAIIDSLEKQLVKLYENDSDVQRAFKQLEKAYNYGPYEYSWTSCGEVAQLLSCDDLTGDEDEYSLKFSALKSLVEDSDLCAYFSKDSSSDNTLVFEVFQGDAITINEREGAFQNRKCIIEKADYCCEEHLAFLIEQHMEKEGCFPLVGISNSHDSEVTYFDTKKAAESWECRIESLKREIKKMKKPELLESLYLVTSSYSEEDTVKMLRSNLLDYAQELLIEKIKGE